MLPQDEVDQRYAGSGCTPYKWRRKGVPARKTWILYPESKHVLLAFQGIVWSTEGLLSYVFFSLLVGSIYFITQSAKLI